MNTRVGKIAQLPKAIRDDLNQRLQNGRQGPELLQWLNQLPETKDLVANKFEGQAITRSNLSDWRQGGYQDWLRLQAREERIQRVTESGGSLKQLEGPGDLFENFARMVIAELADDLESLGEAKDRNERWQRLRELSRELARLQNGYNRSRWADLAWTKWNDRFEDQTQPEPEENQLPPDDQPEDPKEQQKLATITPAANSDNAVVPNRAASCETEDRFLHHAPCGCVCRKCHAEDGPYPYWDAERDAAARGKSSNLVRKDNGESFHLQNWRCDCTCKRCDSKNGGPEADGNPRKSIFRIFYSTKCNCHGFCRKCHAPDSEYPMAEVIRDDQLVNEGPSPILRAENGISTCLRLSLCNCVCDECEKRKLEEMETGQPKITLHV